MKVDHETLLRRRYEQLILRHEEIKEATGAGKLQDPEGFFNLFRVLSNMSTRLGEMSRSKERI